MDKLKMHSRDNVAQNIEAVGRLFQHALTEVMRDGKAVQAIDFDVLRQELSREIVEGREERYAFTWPDKRQAILAANAPIAMALRPIVEDSVGRDGTAGAFDSENLYIEGDNLDVLKLLQETYLGKVTMIYIDPPYNTGNDAFVYDDDFAMADGDFKEANGLYDEDRNITYDFKTNPGSNGRFHTDWLNMIYPRLRVAKSLLADDGVIFISIDDNEIENLKRLCNEIFGESNFIAIINWKGRGGRQDSKYYAAVHEYILCYAKEKVFFHAGSEIKTGDIYPKYDEKKKRYYKTQLLRKWGSNSRREDRPNLFYPITAPDGTDVYPLISNTSVPTAIEGRWRHGKDKMRRNLADDLVEFVEQSDGSWIPYEKIYAPLDGEEKTKKYITWIEDTNDGASVIKQLFGSGVFDYPKTPTLIEKFLKMAGVEDGDLILDFFSGSATTAHAVMQLNAEDGGSRKFIMVQLPEVTDEKSEAYRAGYANICEIGKERIRRARAKIAAETGEKAAGLDLGFRCLRLDTSNMTDVYYAPDAVTQDGLFAQVDNVKADRTPEDLLFQTMLDLGILLSASITVEEIAGKRVFNVADGFLLACFDRDVTDKTVTAIAKRKPYYAVFRDSSMADDSALTNFDQLFAAYSPATVRKVL